MIQPGQRLSPTLPLRAVVGGKEVETTLGKLLRRRAVISVYMRNNTGSCDKQNASLAGAASELDRLGYDIIAVSRDGCGSHAKYAAKLGIGYTLVSDPDDVVSKAADAIVEKSMYGKKYLGPARAAYIVERDGTVLAVLEKVDAAKHAEQVRAAIAAL